MSKRLMNPLRIIFSFLPLAAGMTIAAQSVYPGQHAGKIKIESTVPAKRAVLTSKT